MKKGRKHAPFSESAHENGAGAHTQEPPALQGGHQLEEEIRLRAHELFLERGKNHGHHFDDWLRAERECRERLTGLQPAAEELEAQA
ncbi:MAG: DUF2934 domain-containing protein [Gemmatimonadaceae bacterium]